MVFNLRPVAPKTPSRCIRQLGSMVVTYSAPDCSIFTALVSPMAAEIMPNFVENIPPKPQHSVSFGSGRKSISRTARRSCIGSS